MNRRQFLQRASLATATVLGSRALDGAERPPRRLFRSLGVSASLTQSREMKACGAEYLVDRVASLLMPEKTDTEFAPQRELVAQSAIPVKGCNYFLGSQLRSTGPDADHPRVLAYADIVFRRLRQVGGEFIVFGSGGSRSLPANWPKEKADEQFAALLTALGALAADQKIMLVVESLNQHECNYLTRIGEVAEIIEKVNHPQVRALADFYHLARMGETTEDLARAAPWLGLIEIAEKEKRTAPGTAGDDFRPYFKALADAGYHGDITVEGNWTPDELRRGFAEIARQSAG